MSHYFVSYSRLDAEEIARRLTDKLIGGPPSYPVWLDVRDLQPGGDWDKQIRDAIQECQASFPDDPGQRQRLLRVRGRMGVGAEVQEADHPVALQLEGRAAVSAGVSPVHRLHRRVRGRAGEASRSFRLADAVPRVCCGSCGFGWRMPSGSCRGRGTRASGRGSGRRWSSCGHRSREQERWSRPGGGRGGDRSADRDGDRRAAAAGAADSRGGWRGPSS